MGLVTTRLDGYLLRSIYTPLFATLIVAVMLLVLDQMLRLFDFLLDQNGPVRIVWEMLASVLPEYLVLALPIGFLLGVLLAMRNLSLSSELDAYYSAGLSLPRMSRPVYGLAFVLLCLNVLILGFIEPYSAYRYSELRYQVRSGALGAQIRTGEFIDVGDGVKIRIGRIIDGARELGDIFLERCDDNGECLIAMAREGEFLRREGDERKLVLRLKDSRQIEMTPEGPKARAISIAQQDIPVTLPEVGPFRKRGSHYKEATLLELIDVVRTQTPETFEDYHKFNANLHWRILHSALFLVIPMMAMPLGVVNRRRDFGAGIIVALILVILYYEMIEAGESAAAAGEASPWRSMWPPFFGITAISFYWFRESATRPGARPLAILERLIARGRDLFDLARRRLGAKRA